MHSAPVHAAAPPVPVSAPPEPVSPLVAVEPEAVVLLDASVLRRARRCATALPVCSGVVAPAPPRQRRHHDACAAKYRPAKVPVAVCSKSHDSYAALRCLRAASPRWSLNQGA